MVAALLAAVASSVIALALSRPSPLEAPAERLMEWTPEWAASFLLLHFGTLTRPAALLGALAMTMLAGGVCAALASLLRFPRPDLVQPLAASALLAVVVYSMGAAPDALAMIVPLYLCVLLVLGRARSSPVGRRAFLRESAMIAGGAAVLLVLHSMRPLVNAIAVQHLFPFRAPRGLPIEGVTRLVTPVSSFYVMDKVLDYPEMGPDTWRLVVDGEASRSLRLSYSSLLARRQVHRYVTLECVDNPIDGALISTALWSGVQVRDLLREVGATGDVVVLHAADGYVESVPRRLLEERDALIACGMNGQTLPREHGFPARLVLPGVYGFKSVKWLTHIEIARSSVPGLWSAHGWSDLPEIHTTTRIDVARRSGDVVLVAGVAFAGSRGVGAVEVRVNGGPWMRASLGPALSRSTWVQWAIRLRGKGHAKVEVRGVDGHGRVQSRRRSGPYPDGATGWSTVRL